MGTTYKCRKVCETETGDGKGFHYFFVDQIDVINIAVTCPEHPTAPTRDFVVEDKIIV